jgi:hypothetical protein
MRRPTGWRKMGARPALSCASDRNVFSLFLVAEAARRRWRTQHSSLAEEGRKPESIFDFVGASQKVPVTIPLGCLARSKSTRQEVVRPGQLDWIKPYVRVCGFDLSSFCLAVFSGPKRKRAAPTLRDGLGGRERVSQPPVVEKSKWHGPSESLLLASRATFHSARLVLGQTAATLDSLPLSIASRRMGVQRL